MISAPLLPLWIVDMLGAALVLLLGWRAFHHSRRLLARQPDNPLWLFFYWLSLALFIFCLSRALGHIGGHLLVLAGQNSLWQQLRPYSGGLNAITSIIIASITLFFENMRQLHRRMEANHHQIEETSKEILALNREMEALVMERTMSEMALGMADGIRNPLHVIGGFSNRLLKKAAPDDPARNWAEAIAEAAKRLENMVEKFEDLAQNKKSFFTQEDINKNIKDLLDVLHPEFDRKHIHLIRALHPYPIYATVNKHLLKVAVAHLMRNAIEATGATGEICVTTSADDNYATVVIRDSGRGMPPEIVSRVFEPYFTTKIGGSGLGMVFVRQIVDEHRGTITLDSQITVGTTVTIRLPVRFGEVEI